MFPSLSVLIVLVICIYQPSLADVALPKILLQGIPECAFECVKSFVEAELDLSPTCDDWTNIDCLCEAYSFNDFTIAEGVLACNAELCPTSIYTKFTSIYQICSSDPDAPSPTHTVITATDALLFSITQNPSQATPLQPITITSTSLSTTTMASTTSSHALTTTSSRSSTSLITSQSSIPSLSTSIVPSVTSLVPDSVSTATMSQLSAATSSAAAAAGPVLGTGQIAGIAVAGTVTAATAVGLLFFVFCGRRIKKQRKRRDSDDSFGGSHIYVSDPELPRGQEDMAEAPKAVTPLIPPPARSTQGPKSNQILGLPAAPNQPRNQHRQSWWQARMAGRDNLKPATPSQIGVARHLSPNHGGISQDTSPSSIQSYMTTSRLLPEKPSYSPTNNAHEKKTSYDTTTSQPTPLGGGVGLRVIAPTPEPSERNAPGAYHGYPRSQQGRSHGPRKEPSLEGSKLKGKLSDPFLNKPDERTDPTHPSTAMFKPATTSRPALSKLQTAPQPELLSARGGRRNSHGGKLPNFRSLVKPQASKQPSPPRRTPPPQLPTVAPFSPISPSLPTSVPAIITYNAQNDPNASHSIMDRPRYTQSPFWRPHDSREPTYRPQRTRTRRIRPETHYTTGSETEFEDEEPSPLSPPTLTPPIAIAELPALSPVVESPASRTTQDKIATRTPSPKTRGSPPVENEHGTPLSRLRYPEIPGTSESPRREVGTVPLVFGFPRETSAVHISQLHKSSVSPLSDSPIRRQPSSGSTIISPEFESPMLPQEPSPMLLASPNGQKPKLVPSPLRPGRNSQQIRQVTDDIPPPPPPKDDPKVSYPTPSMASFSTHKFHAAARQLGSTEHASLQRDPWPLNSPPPSNKPVELPARGSGGLGNWPVQPTRPTRQVAPPRPSGEPVRETVKQMHTPESTFASGSSRTVVPESTGRTIVPVPVPVPYGKMGHAQGNKQDRPYRMAANPRFSNEENYGYIPGRGLTADYYGGRSSAEYPISAIERDPRQKIQRLRDMERQRARERQWEQHRQQIDASRAATDFDPSLSTAPLLHPKGNENAPRSATRNWGVDQGQARRDLLAGGQMSGYEIHNQR